MIVCSPIEGGVYLTPTSFDLLNEAGKNVEWVSYDHDYHGYVFPIKGDDGKYILNDVQIGAIDHVVSWLGKKFSESKL